MSEIRTLRDGDIDVLPRTVASAVQTADGSTVEDKLNSIEAPDLSAYATTEYVDGQVDVLESSISGLSQTVTTQGENISALETEVDDLKNSVSDGKTLVANAITAKGVTTATTASFQIMANNILSISTMPSSLSSYHVSPPSGSCSVGYTLVHSKTFSRPIICVTVYGFLGVDGLQIFFPIWGKTLNEKMAMTNFTKTSYNVLPGNPKVTTPDEGYFANSYIKFSSDSKTIYLYIKSLWEGTYSGLDNNINVYY